jgi:DNA-binding XRE family transcriptional regulator
MSRRDRAGSSTQAGCGSPTVECSDEHEPKPPTNVVGPQVRRLRYERGLSQPGLAARCQLRGWVIGRDTIAKIEGQRRWVGDLELAHLARCLGVPVETLYPAAVRRWFRGL